MCVGGGMSRAFWGTLGVVGLGDVKSNAKRSEEWRIQFEEEIPLEIRTKNKYTCLIDRHTWWTCVTGVVFASLHCDSFVFGRVLLSGEFKSYLYGL